MSATRNLYDSCSATEAAKASQKPLKYMMYPGKYYHNDPAMITRGIVGGNNVSLFSGNLVDLESDLRGQTRAASDCSSKKYQPQCMFPGSDPNTGLPCPDSKDNLIPLSSCQILSKNSVMPNNSLFNFARFF